MELFINNQLKWKKTFFVTMNEKYEIVKKILVSNKVSSVFVDLRTERFAYYTNNLIKSEIIIISSNIHTLLLVYNKNSKKYKFDLQLDEGKKYNKILNVTLRDDKNLFYREDKSKNINIYVPYNYSKEKTYRLIIMFDSQNIFDKEKVGNYTKLNDPYGGWQVETSIEYKYDNFIIVGIENADRYRENELTFFDEISVSSFNEAIGCNNKYYLDNLGAFINETLLPYVSSKYNVSLTNMGICGASCGGLAALYTGLKNTDSYGFIFSFTSSIGLLNKEQLDCIIKKFEFENKKNKLPYIFLFQGLADDLEKILSDGNQYMKNLLINNGYDNDLIDEYVEESAMHNEDAWRYAFNYAINKYMEK